MAGGCSIGGCVPVFTDTITVYNRFKEAGKEQWQRRVISGVNWTDMIGAVIRKTGVTPAGSFTLVIPKASMAGYVTPEQFKVLEDRSEHWTVAVGDTVALGELQTEVTATPSKDLAGIDHVRIVSAVDYLAHGSLAHLEVTGK